MAYRYKFLRLMTINYYSCFDTHFEEDGLTRVITNGEKTSRPILARKIWTKTDGEGAGVRGKGLIPHLSRRTY